MTCAQAVCFATSQSLLQHMKLVLLNPHLNSHCFSCRPCSSSWLSLRSSWSRHALIARRKSRGTTRARRSSRSASFCTSSHACKLCYAQHSTPDSSDVCCTCTLHVACLWVGPVDMHPYCCVHICSCFSFASIAALWESWLAT